MGEKYSLIVPLVVARPLHFPSRQSQGRRLSDFQNLYRTFLCVGAIINRVHAKFVSKLCFSRHPRCKIYLLNVDGDRRKEPLA